VDDAGLILGDHPGDRMPAETQRDELTARDGCVLPTRQRRKGAVTSASSQFDRYNRLKCELVFHDARMTGQGAQISTRVLRIA